MQLQIECIRDVLLTAEKEIDLSNHVIHLDELMEMPRLEGYEKEDVIYTIMKLKEAGYIEGDVKINPDGSFAKISHLTYEGHLFLDNIRDDQIWTKAKEKSAPIASSVSINILSQFAQKILYGEM